MDPDFYDTIYCLGNRRVDKWERQMRGFSATNSSFGTANHHLHQARRAPVALSFSKRAIAQLEPVIQKYVDKLVSRLEDAQRGTQAINMFYAYSALTGDIIGEYSFGISQDFLGSPTFSQDWYDLFKSVNRSHFLFKHIGSPDPLIDALPQWLSSKLYPIQILQFRHQLEKRLTEERDSEASDSKSPTIFQEIFYSELPPSEKTIERLIEEATSVTAAGTLTTADTLAVISYHVISNPSVLARLQDEFHSAPSQTLQQLEQLPYLTAIVKEGLRLACGVTSRLARIFVDDPIRYNDWVIPPGTPISMSCQLVHSDQSVFPNPRVFDPERWLGGKERRLEKYLVSFSKGSRQCVGMNLAYAEMYLTLAAVFAPGRFNLELFETSDRDAEVVADIFVPGFRTDSKGIRVKVQ